MKKRKSGLKIFIFVLLAAIIGGLIFVWFKCKEYSEKSAITVLEQICSDMKSETGMDFKYNPIPKSSSKNGEMSYTLTADDKDAALVTLQKVKSGLMGLALYEKKDVECLLSFNILVPSGCRLELYSSEEEPEVIRYDSIGEKYDFAGTDFEGAPQIRLYKTNSVYTLEQVKAYYADTQVEIIPFTDDCYFVSRPLGYADTTTIRERTAEIANTYSAYILNDCSFESLADYITDGSPLYSRFAELDVQWQYYHSYAQIEDLTVSDPIFIGDRWAMVNASYGYYVIYYDHDATIDTEFCLLLHLDDDGYWRMGEMLNAIPYDLEQTPQHAYIDPYSAPMGMLPYRIRVNRILNCATVYTLDENGDYTVPVKSMICATGKQGSETPLDTYYMLWRAKWCYMIDGSYGRYAISLSDDGYMFHSICYTEEDEEAMYAYEYNLLGDFASLGCIRLQTIDARWLYDNCVDGTMVIVYDDESSPGPLGKPKAQIDYIDEAMDNGWDPTDPSPDNPWRYK